MKKTIFELNKEEGKKLNIELMGTQYFRQYIFSYSVIMVVSILMGMFIIIGSDFDKTMALDEGMAMLVLVLFVLLITLLFLFKMLDLSKQYYDEKNNENK